MLKLKLTKYGLNLDPGLLVPSSVIRRVQAEKNQVGVEEVWMICTVF